MLWELKKIEGSLVPKLVIFVSFQTFRNSFLIGADWITSIKYDRSWEPELDVFGGDLEVEAVRVCREVAPG